MSEIEAMSVERAEGASPILKQERRMQFETVKIRTHRQISWTPKEDITTDELARALPLLIQLFSGVAYQSRTYPEDLVAMLPDDVKRHFIVAEE